MIARIELPYSKPPLSMNDRTHWRAKARITAGVRRATKLLAKSANVPTGLAHATGSLQYQPAATRKRDADNLVPVLKACCDGLVDHQLVEDDTPNFMTKLMPLIHPAVKGQLGTLWLEIEWEKS